MPFSGMRVGESKSFPMFRNISSRKLNQEWLNHCNYSTLILYTNATRSKRFLNRDGNPQQFIFVYIFSVCPDFHFLQNVNLHRKCVQIFSSATQICTDLRFGGKENLDKLEKIQTDRNCWGFSPQNGMHLVRISNHSQTFCF